MKLKIQSSKSKRRSRSQAPLLLSPVFFRTPVSASMVSNEKSLSRGNVAQISNLLYRRVALGRPPAGSNALKRVTAAQNAILRYSRLEICATALTCPVSRVPSSRIFHFCELRSRVETLSFVLCPWSF